MSFAGVCERANQVDQWVRYALTSAVADPTTDRTCTSADNARKVEKTPTHETFHSCEGVQKSMVNLTKMPQGPLCKRNVGKPLEKPQARSS